MSLCKIPITLKILLHLSFKKSGGNDLEVKKKLRYYKEVINPNLEDQKYLSFLTRPKKKINIAKERTHMRL